MTQRKTRLCPWGVGDKGNNRFYSTCGRSIFILPIVKLSLFLIFLYTSFIGFCVIEITNIIYDIGYAILIVIYHIFNRGNQKKKCIEMRRALMKFFIVALVIFNWIPVHSQEVGDSLKSAVAVIDSLRKTGIIFSDAYVKPEILLTPEQAVKFLEQRYQSHFWNDTNDPLRRAIGQLVFEASHPPYDSSEIFLRKYPYDSLRISWDKFYIWEPLRFKIPVVTPFKYSVPADPTVVTDTVPENIISDTTIAAMPLTTDTIPVLFTAASDTLPFVLPMVQDTIHFLKPQSGLKDTTILIVIDTLYEVSSSNPSFPFRYMDYPFQGDSIEVAVNSLLKYLEDRDSSIIYFTGLGDIVTPLWLNSKTDNMARYWLKNEFSDSVTVWIGNSARNTVGLYLEQGVNLRRPPKQATYAEARINVERQDRSKLLEVQKIVVKPKYWKYRTETNLAFSQTALSNWVKGGEKSLSSLLDVTGYADYNNKQLKLSSNNFARIKLGFLASGENPVRKNTDLIETNSKLNHKAFGKFDFSTIMLFKTQLAPGYSYSKVNGRDTAIRVSKMINPAILTLGFGLDYKPNAQTSLNFSPLSYKGTYMTDTANIDQTKYGIPVDRKSKHEPGVSFMVSHVWKPNKSISVTNRLQLFTNYVNNPQNVDVDWEMMFTANLNWFTDLRINTHLIFDDDTRTTVLDDNKVPVLNPDGTTKKTARIQFKEMIGVSLAFRF